MAKVLIDGIEYDLREGQNLLEACLSEGLDLPYFCWHPAMGSVGACRQCALVQYQNADDTRGRIVMGCMTPVTEGAIFSLGGDQASTFREAIVESLMLNHPHDCAVCAEGGECHLQDMTVMVGHRDRRYRGRKNTHRNQNLGPLIHHEMNRCITCYRCTRYYRDYAGGTDLAAMAAHDHVYFGRHEDGVLQSEFAGNLVEVCPTGVFTDKTLVGHYTRKWDLQSAPSVCVGCAVGCNTLPGERYGKLKRVHNRFNVEVNGYFLCDRGRFGSAYINNDDRINYAAVRREDGRFDAISSDDAAQHLLASLTGKRVAAIGSPRASVEANFMLRSLVGAGNFSAGFGEHEHAAIRRAGSILRTTAAHVPSIQDIESADAVLVLGDDVTHTAPRLALALRQSVRNRAYEMAADLKLQPWQDAAIRNLAQNQRSPMMSVTPGTTRLDDVAMRALQCAPNDIVVFAQAVARALRTDGGSEVATDSNAHAAADMLRNADKPLIIAGTSLCSTELLDAAAEIADALMSVNSRAMLSIVLPEANTLGQALLVEDGGVSLQDLHSRVRAGELDTLVLMENDLFRRTAPNTAREILEGVPELVVLDGAPTPSCDSASLVLGTASTLESEGTLVSMEGRAQRFFPVFPPHEDRRTAFDWLLEPLANRDAERFGNIRFFDEIVEMCAVETGLLSGIVNAAPGHEYRSHGLRIPRQPHRYSGRTAMRAQVSVHEPKQTTDAQSPLAYSMEGLNRDEPGSLLPYVWSPGWNSNQSLHKFQAEVGGPLRSGTAGVRLLDSPASPASDEHHSAEKSRYTSTMDMLSLVPRPQIYGSDELSAKSAGVCDLVAAPFLELGPAAAELIGVSHGGCVAIEGSDQVFDLRIDPLLSPGCVVYAPGLPGCEGLSPGQSVTMRVIRAADAVIARDGASR